MAEINALRQTVRTKFDTLLAEIAKLDTDTQAAFLLDLRDNIDGSIVIAREGIAVDREYRRAVERRARR